MNLSAVGNGCQVLLMGFVIFGNDLDYLLIANDQPGFSVMNVLYRLPYPFYSSLVQRRFIQPLRKRTSAKALPRRSISS